MGIFLIYLRPNEDIYIRMSIFGRYGSWFLWVMTVLQAVGPQIRAVGPRKMAGVIVFLHYFTILVRKTIHFG